MSQLHGGPGFPARPPRRQESVRTITSVPNRYSGDSDADDEGAERQSREELSLSQSNSSQSSRDVSLVRSSVPITRAVGSGSEDDDDKSIRGEDVLHPGLRTPPSNPKKLDTKRLSTDTVGRYEALFSSLETPRALPVMTPTDENGPLPPAFAKLQGISPHTGKIGDKAPKKEGSNTSLGPAPKLDIEGWKASKDDKPDTWCCESFPSAQCYLFAEPPPFD